MVRPSLWVLLGLTFLAVSLYDVQVSAEVGPTESECRPYIEKAIHELKAGEGDADKSAEGVDSQEKTDTGEVNSGEDKDTGPPGSKETADDDDDDNDEPGESKERVAVDDDKSVEEQAAGDKEKSKEDADGDDDDDDDDKQPEDTDEKDDDDNDDQKSEEAADDKPSEEMGKDSKEQTDDGDDDDDEKDDAKKSDEDDNDEDTKTKDDDDDGDDETASKEKDDDGVKSEEAADDDQDDNKDSGEDKDKDDGQSEEQAEAKTDEMSAEGKQDDDDDNDKDNDGIPDSQEKDDDDDDEKASKEVEESVEAKAKRDVGQEPGKAQVSEEHADDDDKKDSGEDDKAESKEGKADDDDDDEDDKAKKDDKDDDGDEDKKDADGDDDDDEEGSEETRPEDDLLLEGEIPENLRDRSHITELLHLDDEHEPKEKAIDRVAEIILRDLKRIYENAIKPLEVLYKYRDLSNRHFGDPEIFSKPLILFMGPWSGGKSTIINYLTGNEYTMHSLRTGAEPSPAYFNILMHGKEPEVLDGTQLAADWTFSGLQKFGQGLEDRLRGLKLPNKLLEKVNIVEIPGILEVRKQVSRLFPFNDACQWFIDRADIIFLVYDPAKLDVGPETEAILDQLKGREYQTRIVLNKADQVKPEELLRVQSALIWNISPLMSSAQPPTMYTTSLWSHPYETSSPVRLLQAQERAFLRDIRSAIDKRIENKIASARRFAVRVRNHAKMVDCYLTTYYNHKTLFGNKKRISDQIIENPQNYHIYEGLSTLTNISRYDLPDPDVYRDFFRLNPLFEFKKLSETCTYFRGCPINKLDVAIAYDLPELVGKYKKLSDQAVNNIDNESDKSKS